MIYVSIDTETTGLDSEVHQLLEVGMVIEDTEKKLPFEEIPKYKAIIDNGDIKGSPFALKMNARIIEILANIPRVPKNAGLFDKAFQDRHNYIKEHNILKPNDLELSIYTFLTSNGFTENNNGVLKLNVAGKNFGSFDKSFLDKVLQRSNNPYYTSAIEFGHRNIDPANFFIDFKEDKEIPSLTTCLERAGINDEITHNALLDAWDVVRALRFKY